VHAIDRFDWVAFQHAFLDHQPGSALVLLGGLKDEMDRAGEIAGFCEVFGRAEEHCGMAVVTTGVHPSVISRGMRNIVLFFDVQRIHIGAQSNRTVARQRAFERADDAGPGDAPIDRNAE
jgi:hypothetical protein